MIPGTLLGALFLAACLVPGFVFLLVAERRRAQKARSTLIEVVELAGVGAVTSLIAAMLVLGFGRTLGLIDNHALARDPGAYVLLHPFRGLGSLAILFTLSCLVALVAALLVFAKDARAFDPGGSAWSQVFLDDRPKEATGIAVTVELCDQRRIMGRVRTFSSELEDSREIALTGPFRVQATPGAAFDLFDGDFMLLREEHIVTITGNYIRPADSSRG
jgi:hypothetical protein